MKDKEKEIKQIAQKIIDLEHKCQEDIENRQTYLNQMIKITEDLSLEELLEIDEYIMENNLLTK